MRFNMRPSPTLVFSPLGMITGLLLAVLAVPLINSSMNSPSRAEVAGALAVSSDAPLEGSLLGATFADHVLIGEIVGLGGPEMELDPESGLPVWDSSSGELPTVRLRVEEPPRSLGGNPLDAALVGTEIDIVHSSAVLEVGARYALFVGGSDELAFYYAHDLAADIAGPGLASGRTVANTEELLTRFPASESDRLPPRLSAIVQWVTEGSSASSALSGQSEAQAAVPVDSAERIEVEVLFSLQSPGTAPAFVALTEADGRPAKWSVATDRQLVRHRETLAVDTAYVVTGSEQYPTADNYRLDPALREELVVSRDFRFIHVVLGDDLEQPVQFFSTREEMQAAADLLLVAERSALVGDANSGQQFDDPRTELLPDGGSITYGSEESE